MAKIYRATHNLTPDYVASMFNNYIPSRSLRFSNQNLLKVPKARTLIYQNTLSVAGVDEYNNLPKSMRDSESLTSFKNSCNNFLYNTYLSDAFS